MTRCYVAAEPYPWPYDGDLRPANTALIVIDMQTDFCGIGGYVDRMGYDLTVTRAPIEPIAAVLATMRRQGFHVFHTREGLGRTSPTFRRTSAGARASAPA
jgi:biuret amidohydrolase